MMKMAILGLAMAAGAASTANAARLPLPSLADGGVVPAAEQCGAGGWRSGLDGRCRPLGPFRHGYPGFECPAGWHVGPRGGACWPNR